MLKLSVMACVLLFNLIVQSAVFPFIEVFGLKPDTFLILIISFALLSGNPLSVTFGFVGGLFQDILYGHALGFYTIQYMLLGYLAGFFYNRFSASIVVLPVSVVFISSLLRGAMMLVAMLFERFSVPISHMVLYVLLPEAIYTALITPLIFFGLKRLYKYKFMYNRWYFRRKV